MLNIFLFFFTFVLITMSTIGLGIQFRLLIEENGLKIRNSFNEFGITGLYGIFIIIFISLFTSIFIKHGIYHNLFLLMVGLFFFFKNKISLSNLNKISILSFLIVLISILISKNNDDFHYYHFPYTYLLTEFNHPVGLGHFGLGLRTPSSIFFLNSTFYLPFIKEYGFNFGQALILLFSNFYLLEKIFLNNQKENSGLPIVFSLLAFGFINIFFYRISDHGTDRSAQILIFILVLEIVNLITFVKTYQNRDLIINFYRILFIILIIVSLKALYVLYFLFLIPVINIIIKHKDFFFLIKIIFSYKIIIFIIFFCLIFLIYFFNTGCLIYPLKLTCIENVSWYLGNEELQKLSLWYEQWSKAGAGPNFRINNPEEYVQNFNWVSNWMRMYFFNQVSDFLIGLIVLIIISSLLLKLKIKKKINIEYDFKNFSFLIILFLLLFFIWFLNHPTLRYGGFVVIASIFFLIICLFLDFKKYKSNTVVFFLILCLVVGLLRNIKRLNEEISKYNYNPIKNVFYTTDQYSYRFSDKIKKINLNYQNCNQRQNEECKENQEFDVKKLLSKYIYIKK